MKTTKTIFGLSLFASMIAAIAPMFCCWGPALLISIAGISGGAACFSWVHPLKPYFFGIAFLSLGYAFYRTYKSQKAEQGSCPNCKPAKPSFFKSKLYIWLVAGFILLMFVTNYFPGILH